MKYLEIKKKRADDMDALFKSLGVFWAFSNEQFKEGLDKLIENNLFKSGEKLVELGGGGYIPKRNVELLIDGTNIIKEIFDREIKENNARIEHILYELNNHEAFYTGSIDDTMKALGKDFTADEVMEVYKNNQTKK